MTQGRKDKLSGLLSSLSSAVTALQAALASQNLPPFDLDDPTPHPLDIGLPDPTSWYARKAIVGLCHQIGMTVQHPAERAFIDGVSHLLPASLNVVLESEPPIANLIAQAGPAGEDISKLAKTTGIDVVQLRSVFRVLTCEGYFREVSHDRFVLNRPASALVGGNANASPDLISWVSGPSLSASSLLSQHIRQEMPDNGRKGSSSTRSKNKTIFESYFGVPMFLWLKQNPAQLSHFHRGMTQGELFIDPGIATDYPWTDLGANTTLVDVGGGMGGQTMELLKRFKGWTAVLQDRAEVVASAKEFWQAQAPDIMQAGRITFMIQDFHQPSALPPASHGQEYVFFIKNILHNWPDNACVQILKNLSPAAGPGTTLLIVNYTPPVPKANVPISVADYFAAISGKSMSEIRKLGLGAPEPLANWGYGSAALPMLDLLMFTLLNSTCRTEDELGVLLAESSWKLEGTTEMRAALSVTRATKLG